MSECPNCGGALQQHTLTWWCNRCGWGRNKPKPPPIITAMYEALARINRQMVAARQARR